MLSQKEQEIGRNMIQKPNEYSVRSRLSDYKAKLIVSIMVTLLSSSAIASPIPKKRPDDLWLNVELIIKALASAISLIAVVAGLYYMIHGLRALSTDKTESMGQQDNAGTAFMKLIGGAALMTMGGVIAMVLFTASIDQDQIFRGNIR